MLQPSPLQIQQQQQLLPSTPLPSCKKYVFLTTDLTRTALSTVDGANTNTGSTLNLILGRLRHTHGKS